MPCVLEDEPNWPVIMLVKMCHMADMSVIFTSGRDETARHDTMQWLEEHVGTPDFQLLLRDAGDSRADEIVKQEMLDKVRLFYNIIMVFDDRQKVVNMWRANGLTCLQVTPGPDERPKTASS